LGGGGGRIGHYQKTSLYSRETIEKERGKPDALMEEIDTLKEPLRSGGASGFRKITLKTPN